MIEDYTRRCPSLTLDWVGFDRFMAEEARKSKLFSIYNKTIKTNQTVTQHPTEQISDLLKQNSSLAATNDDPFKYQSDRSLDARVQLVIQRKRDDLLESVQSVNATDKYYILLDRTNFYATAGGQASDFGTIHFSNDLVFRVEYDLASSQRALSTDENSFCSPLEMSFVYTAIFFTTVPSEKMELCPIPMSPAVLTTNDERISVAITRQRIS